MILVVDDNADIREMVCMALAEGGYQAEGASNGQEAMVWLHREAAPSVILLDLTMPVMNGHQLLSLMESDPLLASVPVVVMTARDRDLAGPGPRVFEHLSKPFTTSALLAAVRTATR